MTTSKNSKSKNLQSDLEGPKHVTLSTCPENGWQLSTKDKKKTKKSTDETPVKMPVLKIEPTPSSNSYDLLSDKQEPENSEKSATNESATNEHDSKEPALKKDPDSKEPNSSNSLVTIHFLMGTFVETLEKKLLKETDLKIAKVEKATDTKIAAVKETVDNLVRSTDALETKIDDFTQSSTIPDLIQDKITNLGIDDLITNKVSSHLDSLNVNPTTDKNFDPAQLTSRILILKAILNPS